MDTVCQIIVQRVLDLADDDRLQIESLQNLEFSDTEQAKRENPAAIEILQKRQETLIKLACVIQSKGIMNLGDFRLMISMKFFTKGHTGFDGPFYLKVDRLLTTIETLIQLGYTACAGDNLDNK